MSVDNLKLLEARIDVLQNEIRQALGLVNKDFTTVMQSVHHVIASLEYRISQLEEELEMAGIRAASPVPVKGSENSDDKNTEGTLANASPLGSEISQSGREL
jgi:hypothetical protein